MSNMDLIGGRNLNYGLYKGNISIGKVDCMSMVIMTKTTLFM